MKTRSTLLLVAVAVVALALGLYYGAGSREQQAAAVAQPAFPGLAGKLAQAAALDISQAGKALHLARKGETWVLPDKGGYRAKDTHVHELLAGLAELKLAEPRTANPAEYSRLGVEDPSKDAKDSGATLVRVLDDKGAPIAQLLVGHTRESSGGGEAVYVRRPGEAQAWLAEGRLAAEADPTDWLDQDIVDIAADKIVAVTVTRGAETLQFVREAGKFDLKTPADHPKLDGYKVDDVAGALARLTLDDVRPAPAPGTQEGQAVFSTSDGMTVTATVSKDGDKVWAAFSVAGDDKAKPAAEALAAKLKGWAYQIGAWKETAFVPTLAQLLPAQPPAPAPAAAPPAQ